MDISLSIKNIKREFEFLQERLSVISLQHDHEGMKIHFHRVEGFLRAIKGFNVIAKGRNGEFEEYFAIIDGVRCFILVDEEEERQLLEGLENERVTSN